MNDTVTTLVSNNIPPAKKGNLLDVQLPTYDVVLTEHLVIEADTDVVFQTAKNFDFMTTRSLLVTAVMTARSVPSRLLGRPVVTPRALLLARDPDVLPGWLFLGEVPGREVVFGAVGTFWKADIEWHDLPADRFADFAEPGWGKIACHLLVRPDGPDRSILSYECRTATTDPVSQAQMSRYWWLIRPFVSYVLRAVLRTIRGNVAAHV
ncbi:MAG: hypothetical protein QOF53_2287 [Nocardioidaceae bacterium]|nr:hypothetical protein [Nocardioidaceae bacterium]